MQPEDNPGYILRVSTDEWLDQIYQLKKYYTGVNRNWKRGTPILLAKKTQQGDSILGYGITQKVEMLWGITYKSVVNFTFRGFLILDSGFKLRPKPSI